MLVRGPHLLASGICGFVGIIETNNEFHREQGVPPVDPLEQVVQSQATKIEPARGNELAVEPRRKRILEAAMVLAVTISLLGGIHHGEETND